MPRAHNFSAGPAVLPTPVIAQLREVLGEFGGARAGIMEISHRSPDFQAVIDSAEARLRRGGWAWISTLGELSDLQVPEKVLNTRWRRLGVGVTQDTERRGPNIVVVLIVGG